MQRPDPVLGESSADAVGDSGGDTTLACANWGCAGSARGTQTMCARRDRGLQSLRLIMC